MDKVKRSKASAKPSGKLSYSKARAIKEALKLTRERENMNRGNTTSGQSVRARIKQIRKDRHERG